MLQQQQKKNVIQTNREPNYSAAGFVSLDCCCPDSSFSISSSMSDDHRVRLSLNSCTMSVVSLYESSVKPSSELMAASKAFLAHSQALSGAFLISQQKTEKLSASPSLIGLVGLRSCAFFEASMYASSLLSAIALRPSSSLNSHKYL